MHHVVQEWKVEEVIDMRIDGRMRRVSLRIKWDDTEERINQQREKQWRSSILLNIMFHALMGRF